MRMIITMIMVPFITKIALTMVMILKIIITLIIILTIIATMTIIMGTTKTIMTIITIITMITIMLSIITPCVRVRAREGGLALERCMWVVCDV